MDYYDLVPLAYLPTLLGGSWKRGIPPRLPKDLACLQGAAEASLKAALDECFLLLAPGYCIINLCSSVQTHICGLGMIFLPPARSHRYPCESYVCFFLQFSALFFFPGTSASVCVKETWSAKRGVVCETGWGLCFPKIVSTLFEPHFGFFINLFFFKVDMYNFK